MTPFNHDAEREVLASLAFHGRSALGALPATVRNPLAFSPEFRGLFRVLSHLADRDAGAHPAQVREAALALGENEIATNPDLVSRAIDSLGTLESLPHFAGIVGELYARREIRTAAEIVVRHAEDRAYPIDALIRDHIGPLVTRAAPPVPSGDGMLDAIEMLENESALGGSLPGIPTGLPSLDNLLDGLCPERLIVLAARPGCGKTAFALHCAQHAAGANDSEVYFVTLEQPQKQLQKRRLAMVSGIDLRTEIRRGRWPQLAGNILELASRLKAQSITFDERTDTATGIALAVQRHSLTVAPVKLVVVDYLSWIRFEGKYERNDIGIGSVTRALARLSKDAHCAVLLLVQLSRASVKEGRPRQPNLSDLKDAGNIEQDADQVVMLWEPPIEGMAPSNDHAVMEFVVAKNRHGPTGNVRVEWAKATYRYREAPRFSLAA